jgi:hypothetical protein
MFEAATGIGASELVDVVCGALAEAPAGGAASVRAAVLARRASVRIEPRVAWLVL